MGMFRVQTTTQMDIVLEVKADSIEDAIMIAENGFCVAETSDGAVIPEISDNNIENAYLEASGYYVEYYEDEVEEI